MASIRPYKSKQWRAVVRRTGYKVQSAIFDLKDDAVTWARDIEGRMDKRTFVDASRHDEETVASLFEKRASGVYHNTAAIIDASPIAMIGQPPR